VSTTDWDDARADDAERVDPDELDDVPPGTADEESEAGLGLGTTGTDVGGGPANAPEEPGGWTEGGGLPPEGQDADVDADTGRDASSS
jgi:hypothetical protein